MAGQFVVLPSNPTVGPAGSPTLLVAANPLRWAILFSQAATVAPAGGTVQVAPFANPTATTGFQFTTGALREWHVRNYPGMVQVAWFGVSSGPNANTIQVIEIVAQQ